MTDRAWPDTLPKTLLLEGLSATRKSSVVRTQMDAGPVKTRRRYTASVNTFSGKMLLNRAQCKELELFYKNQIADGALRFLFTDPRTLEMGEFRFTEDYKETAVDGFIEVQMSLERL